MSVQIRIARTQTYLVVRKNGVEPHLAFSLFSVPTNGKMTLPGASGEIQAATLILREAPATVGTTIFRHAGSGPDLGVFYSTWSRVDQAFERRELSKLSYTVFA